MIPIGPQLRRWEVLAAALCCPLLGGVMAWSMWAIHGEPVPVAALCVLPGTVVGVLIWYACEDHDI